jgi:hypothetical protein
MLQDTYVSVLIYNDSEKPAIFLCGRYVAPISIFISFIATKGNGFLTIYL